MLDPDFDDNEALFRAVGVQPSFWDEEKRRPSSGAFKDAKGLSVDRQAQRTKEESIDFLRSMKNAPIKCIAVIPIPLCKEIDVLPKYEPEADNEYHSEIHDSAAKILISSGKARKLATKAEIKL